MDEPQKHYTVDPHGVKTPCITLKSVLCIHVSTYGDSTNLRLYSTVVHTYGKKYVHKWTGPVQTHAVQESNVLNKTSQTQKVTYYMIPFI